MKRAMSILTAAALLLSLTVSALAAETESLPWYAEAQDYVTKEGIMTAVDGDFQPDGPVTRGVVFQTLYRMAGAPTAPAASFTDTAGTWYADAAGWAEYTGLAAVPESKRFDGDRLITRGELAAIFHRYGQQVALLSTPEDVPDLASAPDYADVASWAADGLKWCLSVGVLSGKPGGLLDPNGTAVRAELAQMLFKLSQVEPLYSDAKQVRLLATSDLHGWFVPWDFALDEENTAGSLTYLATRFAQERAKNKNVVLVDCGDAVQANYVEYFIDHQTNPMVAAMNALDYDLWTWGNHEYNFDFARRAKLAAQFDGAVLSGNVYLKGTDKRYMPATTVVERDGVRLGFIGLTTPLIEEFEAGKGTLDQVDVHSPIEETKLAIQELKKQNVDAVIGVFHMGLDRENDVEGSSVSDIANAFPELDVIVAGHAHQLVPSQTVNGVLITEPQSYAKVYSAVDLTFAPDGDGGYQVVSKRACAIPAGREEDSAMVELMAPYKAELSSYVNTPIGTLINSDLNGTDKIKGISAGYTEATGIWNLLFSASMYYSGAQAVILNTDYENAGFPVGDVSIKSISSSYSYSGGEITVYKVTGADLKALLEYSAEYFNQIKPGDLTVSYNPERRQSKYSTNNIGGGITYCLDLTQEAGKRVKDLCLITDYHEDGTPVLDDNGMPKTTPITDDMEILLGTNSYSMNKWLGEGGCLAGRQLEIVFSSSEKWGDDGTVRALAIRYIKEALKGTVDGDTFNYDNWYLYTGIDETSPAYQKAVELINNGTLTLPALENGRTNVRSITEADVAPYL